MSSSSSNRLPAYATCGPERAAFYAQRTENGDYDLMPWEIAWRDRAAYLQGRGYVLRPRYQPGWTPSWINTNRDPHFCEDSIRAPYFNVIDATSTRDGSRVSIKMVKSSTEEADIGLYLSRPEIRRDPRNHCVPILEVLPDPVTSSQRLVVMPFLSPFNDPEFIAIGEVVEFVRQTLEGLSFMHLQGIAHRDCAAGNIMMDARPLYPQGYHPVRRTYTPDALWDVHPLARIDNPVQYFFIDFGISSRFAYGETALVVGTKGRDKEPPELSDNVPYNPFMLDVYILGNVYKKEFAEKYHGLEFLQPLISSMCQKEPRLRPTADEAHLQFMKIRAGLNPSLLRWRLRSRSETAPERVVYDTVAAAKEGIYHLKRLVT
ncbi:hypothetical protein K474DRAFT_1707023 [Panus rudis PR-1116 ss-1]|nr:hypothetical protein K474DRAFT_1707023 [Panus rudis PR-1116 ss-1]